MLFLILVWISSFLGVLAQPAILQYSDCFSGSSTDQKLDISTVYAQLIRPVSGAAHINLTLVGSTPETIVEASNGTDAVASESLTGRHLGGSSRAYL